MKKKSIILLVLGTSTILVLLANGVLFLRQNSLVPKVQASPEMCTVSNDVTITGNLTVDGNIVMGYEIQSAFSTGGEVNIWMGCSAGKKVLGGACVRTGSTSILRVSVPMGDGGWQCIWADPCAADQCEVRAICARIN